MGAIAGAIRLDGVPADRALVARLRGALAHRAPCDTLEIDPARPSLAFDGRIDNRRELTGLLEIRGPCPDRELVLAAYRQWGESCAVRLLGDFAFAIWDPASLSLFCARDIVGVRPFFYAAVDGTFVFASELHALFQHPRLQRTPNEGMVAEFLNDTVRSREETLFRDVRRLPPSHALRVGGGRLALRRYWIPQAGRSDRDRPDVEYASELKAILRESVGCRCDTPRAAAQLSGGLDSSSVVATAATLPWRPDVHTYSLVFPGRPFDESRYIAEVVRHAGVRHTALNVPSWDGEWFARQTEQYLECPLGPTAGVLAGMFTAVRADGFASMLTGEGADEWFTGSAQNYADLIARAALRELARELVHAPHPGVALRRLVFSGVWPLMPARMRRPIRAAVRAVARRGSTAEWLNPSFAQRTDVADRCRRPEYGAASGLSRATWEVAQCVVDGTQALAFEVADRVAARCGIEERHPFYDRRVIEFALALPEAQRAARGVRKRVLRTAMSGLLPEAVCRRADKADFTPLYLDWFAAIGGEAAFDRLAIADAGWVRAGVLRRTYRHAVAAVRAGSAAPALPGLWNVVAIEAWFRAAIAREPLRAAGAMAAT